MATPLQKPRAPTSITTCLASAWSASGAPPTSAAAGTQANSEQARAVRPRIARDQPAPPPSVNGLDRRAGAAMELARRSDAVAQPGYALVLGAMRAAEDRSVLLEAVADDMDAAIRACRRQCVDRAFEAVEGVTRAVEGDLKRLVVVVAAGLASGHGCLVPVSGEDPML